MREGLRRADRLCVVLQKYVFDFTIAAFAAWTVIYDAGLVLRWTATAVFVLWLLTLPAAGWFATRTPAPRIEVRDGEGLPARLLLAAGAAVLTCGVVVLFVRLGSQRRWDVAWALCVCVAIGLLAIVLLGDRRIRDGVGSAARIRVPENLIAVAVAVLIAPLSLFVLRPDADDVFYVNRSTWIAQRDTLPLRDTVFSDERFRSLQYPPISSIEALLGVVARVLHLAAPDVVYYLVPPLATLLSVLALWWLLQLWGPRWPLVALGIALLFLLLGGAVHASFGNLFIARMWQGKVMLLCAGLPLLFSNLSRAGKQLDPALAVLLLLSGIAAVGLATTALLVVPLVALAGVVSIVLERPRQAAVAFIAAAAYPLLLAAAIHFLPGARPQPSPIPFSTAPLDTFVKVFGTGVYASVAVAGTLGAALALRRGARVTAAAAAALAFGFVLAPGVLRFIDAVTGSGAILWRLLWVAPVPAMLGAGTTLLVGRFRSIPAAVPPLAVALAVLAAGTPLWSAQNHAQLHSPSWKLDPVAVREAAAIEAQATPGDLVLAPIDASWALAVSTTRLKPVDPRPDYVDGLADVPSFHAPARRVLTSFAQGGQADAAALRSDLDLLHVDLACVPATDSGAASMLATASYHAAFAAADLDCYSR